MNKDNQINLSFLSKNIYCKIQKHEPFTLSKACFNKDCKYHRLMCDQCEIDVHHNDHKLETFSFSDIEEQMDQKIKLDVDEIVQSLNDFHQLLEKISMKTRLLSKFPKIDQPSYDGIQQYINIIIANIELRDQKIVFKGYSQTLRSFKEKLGILQVELNKICDNLLQQNEQNPQNLLNVQNTQNLQNLQNLWNDQNSLNSQNSKQQQNQQNQDNQLKYQNQQNLQNLQNEQNQQSQIIQQNPQPQNPQPQNPKSQNSQPQNPQPQNPLNIQSQKQEESILKQISKNILCKKENHTSNQIVKICLSSECEFERLLCKKCLEAQGRHYPHQEYCIPISYFDRQCAKFTLDNQQETRIKLIKKELDDILNDLDQDFLNILKPNQFIQMYLQKNEIKDYDDLNTAIEQLTNYVEINDLKFKLSDENTLNLYIYSKFKNFAWNMYDLIKSREPCIEIEKLDQNEIQPSILIKDEMKQQSVFYKQKCSYSIQILNLRTVKKHSNTKFNDVALLSKEIDPNQFKSYLFRINKQNGVIGIGFANAVLIHQKGYILNNMSKLGNGIFMIASYPEKTAISYNDKDQNYNNKQQGINFIQDHRYQLTYDPKNTNRQQFCIEIIDSVVVSKFNMPMVIEINEQFHPFILIGLKDDEVELLSEI